jgi:hypothetical protein
MADRNIAASLVPLALAPLLGAQTYTWIQNPANGHSYAVTAPMDWGAAEAEAQRVGGHLVTIRSQTENDWLVQTFGTAVPMWIGFNDVAAEGTWIWSSGEPVTFTRWAPGEPNNSNGEDYGHFDSSTPGLWNDTGYAGGVHHWTGIIELSAPVASYTTYRSSCSSSAGTPQLTNLTLPRAGQRLELQVSGLGANKVGYLLFGFADDVWSFNLLPLDLTALGATGCFLNIAPVVSLLVPSDGAGVARPVAQIPNDQGVLGLRFFNQYVSLNDSPPGRLLPITTTNAGRGVVGI